MKITNRLPALSRASGQHDQGDAAAGPGRSRRGLLAGAAGALGVLAAESIATAPPAAASQGQFLQLGVSATGATAATVLSAGNSQSPSASLADPATGDGVQGSGNGAGSGVLGNGGSSNGTGVVGFGGPTNGNGVQGQGHGSGSGVVGFGGGANGVGVAGAGGGIANAAGVAGTGAPGGGPGVTGTGGSSGGNGVEGFGTGNGGGVTGLGAGDGTGVTGQGGPNGGGGVTGVGGGGQIGVFGRGGPGGGAGVAGAGGTIGLSGNSNGVEGFAGNAGDGVTGSSPAGSGVHGTATAAGGVGVLAEHTAGGVAFRATGPAVFSRSGVLTVAAGKTSAIKTGVALTAASLVLATLQQDKTGVWVRSAVPNVAGSSFTVHLSKAPSASTKVAWFVIN